MNKDIEPIIEYVKANDIKNMYLRSDSERSDMVFELKCMLIDCGWDSKFVSRGREVFTMSDFMIKFNHMDDTIGLQGFESVLNN